MHEFVTTFKINLQTTSNEKLRTVSQKIDFFRGERKLKSVSYSFFKENVTLFKKVTFKNIASVCYDFLKKNKI